MFDIILFGIQGSGKGTQGKILAAKYSLEIFETGSELRKLSEQDTDLAKKVKSIIEAGHLVPNEVVVEIIENFMQHLEPGKSVLFDGIPRKKDQAGSFEEVMKRNNRKFMGVFMALSQDQALERLLARRICEKCKSVFLKNYTKETCENCGGKLITRSDDNPESIKNRFKAFNEETMPVIEDYKNRKLMIEVDGTKSVEEVSQELFKKLDVIF